MFQLICNQTPRFTIGDCAAGHRADNRDKNRNVLIVPRKYKDSQDSASTSHNPLSLLADNFRPYITSFQGNNCTDYINAVFVDVSIRVGWYFSPPLTLTVVVAAGLHSPPGVHRDGVAGGEHLQ